MKNNHQTRRVIFQPTTAKGLQHGINQIVGAVTPTLGPLPRQVAFHQVLTNKMPEMLSKGGVIAKRIVQLPDRNADMGAMLARDMLWDLHQRYGDGAATAAVLLKSIYNEGVKYLASGGNAMMLRRALEEGLTLVLAELEGMTTPIEGKAQLEKIALSACQDPPLAETLGEVFDVIGPYGQLEIRPHRSRKIRREYVDGMAWRTKPFSRSMLTEKGGTHVEIEEPAVLITDLEIEDADQLLRPMMIALRAGFSSMLILATKLSTSSLSVVMVNQDPEKFHALAVRAPGPDREEEAAAIEDMAILTGGRPFRQAVGDTLSSVEQSDLGRARRVWVEPERFGIVGAKGDPRKIREHIRLLKSRYDGALDPGARDLLQRRIGGLMGGAALIHVGGESEHAIEGRRTLAEQAAGSLRGALRDGVVPGGGVAFLSCRPALEARLAAAFDPDERAGYRILLEAMEAPARTIFANAGYEPSAVMARLAHAGVGSGFDVFSGQVVDVVETGIVDVASVARAAIGGAVSAAALALTVDVLVHPAQPEEVLSKFD
jgi:chaperonin GroEL